MGWEATEVMDMETAGSPMEMSFTKIWARSSHRKINETTHPTLVVQVYNMKYRRLILTYKENIKFWWIDSFHKR
jgi:hypothetical protein